MYYLVQQAKRHQNNVIDRTANIKGSQNYVLQYVFGYEKIYMISP